MFYIKLAWRNIFRNKRRTIIASIAIAIGLAALIFTASVMEGMKANMMKAATDSFLGQAQIHGGDFRESQAVETVVVNPNEVLEKLKTEPRVKHFAPRTLSMATVASSIDMNVVMLAGIDPGMEKELSKIDDAMKEGEFFKGSNPRDIVIGSKMAEILEIGLGDRVVVTTTKAGTGDLGQEMFRVSGIYHFDIKELDSGMAFIRLPVAQKMLGIDNGVHQIAIKFDHILTSTIPDLPFWEKYSQGGNEAVSWTTIVPAFKAVSDMTIISIIMLVVILGAVVVFGIINTLFMSLYERMFEFAVLRAVGTRPGGVRKLIILEAGALAVISIILGLILAILLNVIFSHTGIDYRGIEFAGTTMHEMMYPEAKAWHYIAFPVGVIVFTMVVGLYPAFVAGRLKVAEALRKSL